MKGQVQRLQRHDAKKRKATAQQERNAYAALRLLGASVRTWAKVNRIRRGLPAKFAKRIPPSRGDQVLAIVRQLQGAGALTVRGRLAELRRTMGLGGLDPVEELGDFGVAPVVVVAIAGGVAVVAAAGATGIYAISRAIPAIQSEARLAQSAEHAARAAMAGLALEREQSADPSVGAETARDYARARAGDTRSILVAPTMAEAARETAIAAASDDLPAWMLPAGILAGAALVATVLLRK